MSRFDLALMALALALVVAPAQLRAQETMTVSDAFDQAELLLDNGGNPTEISAPLHHTRGLTRRELRRLEIIDGRGALLSDHEPGPEEVSARR